VLYFSQNDVNFSVISYCNIWLPNSVAISKMSVVYYFKMSVTTTYKYNQKTTFNKKVNQKTI